MLQRQQRQLSFSASDLKTDTKKGIKIDGVCYERNLNSGQVFTLRFLYYGDLSSNPVDT